MAATSASPAAAAAVTIKAIDATAVHRIQSGQVIVNLCSVAKELVENSLDAGATSIEVRFKNQGLDAIEVQDNGSGIAPHNYASLALKHYTSKLATYDDLDTLQTFGFRGEALSSLCALSRFSVTTCLASDVPKGTKLEFETSGKLGTTSVVAAQKGTTVCVENLFWNLPVRRRELERNIKREWTKVIGLLNQYACIQTGVKFTVSQQPSKGKKVVLFSTKGNAATRDNIINVFGAKTMGALLALDLTLEMATTRPSVTAGSGGGTHEVKVLGYVSRPAHGQGRQTPDRQMFYVNGRPCKLPQFAQLFGEVYRSYNSGQSPFIFADIQLDTHLYDVNVSPDKQTILLHDQGRMLDTLRESLIELFEKQDITVPISQLASQKLTAFKKAVSATPSTPSRPTTNGRTERMTPAPAATAKVATRSAVEDISEEEEDDEPVEEPPSGARAQDTGAAPDDGPDEPPEDNEETSPSQPAPALQESRDSISNVVVYPVPSKRPSDDTATVTVGDTTTTTITLSPIRKRPKITANITSRSSRATSSSIGAKVQKKKPSKPLPSFGGRLTQMFSAARRPSRDEDDEELVDGDGEEEDVDEEIDDDEIISEDDKERSSQEESADDHRRTNDEDMSNAEDDEAKVDDEDLEEDPDQDMFVDRNDNQELDDPEDDNDRTPSSMEDLQDEVPEDNNEPTDQDDVRQAIKYEEETHVGEEAEVIDEDLDAGEDEDMEQDPRNTRTAPTTDTKEYTDEEKRSRLFLKQGGSKKRHETLQLVQVLKANEALVKKQALSWQATASGDNDKGSKDKEDDDEDGEYRPDTAGGLDDTEAVAEAKLALTIVKSDFAKMRIIGQFNLGFILAVREASRQGDNDIDSEDGESAPKLDDELFIIDQHASDEKYNFERLQASTVVQSQRLVQPKKLELTAVEEEIVLEHLPALAANGFVVDAVLDGSEPVGSRCRLRTLPLSRETTFDLTDLEELIALLGDHSDAHDHHAHEGVSGSQLTAVPRPAKVRKMFAMRACRSSIMIGKALSRRQMASVLAHMGEMDKPWNCPHGRPTMRHLCSLGAAWDKTGRTWGGGADADDSNGDGQPVCNSEWSKFLKKRRRAANRA